VQLLNGALALPLLPLPASSSLLQSATASRTEDAKGDRAEQQQTRQAAQFGTMLLCWHRCKGTPSSGKQTNTCNAPTGSL
jgi:hypothetical protein